MKTTLSSFIMNYLFLLLCLVPAILSAQVREYQLTIDYGRVEVAGAEGMGMLVNKQYPGPTLYFTEGDTAKITVINNMEVNSSIHWHGLLVPYDQDGVPYLSNLPIPPKGTYVYEFPIKHHGTYWYHSHVGLQEQQGVHGAIVIEAKQARFPNMKEAVLVLQDWTRENPDKVLANLKKDGDYYAMKKDAVVHLWGYWKNKALANWWQSQWTRMGGMDVSDIGYDAFLINGKKEQTLFENAQPGETVRLRIINSGASTYFYVHSAEGLSWQVVAADGGDLVPFSAKEIFHAPAETYDVLVTIPHHGAHELRATAQDGTGFASVFIGSGEKYFAKEKTRPNLYQSHNAHSAHTNEHSAHAMEKTNQESKPTENIHDHHQMNHLAATEKPAWSYQLLKTEEPSSLPQGDIRDVELRLTGDMRTYNWSFNDVPLSAADKIKIKRGEVVRFHFINETMMDHPLHLHGHFFRVLVGNGAYDPLKHTVNVAPFEKLTIEFYANEEKDWFFHCHNLYHHKAGMARVISYEDSDIKYDFLKHHAHDDFYYAGNVKLLNDYGKLDAKVFNSKHGVMFEATTYEYEYQKAELIYFYRQSTWLNILLGIEADEYEEEFKIGFSYVLPLLIDANVYWNDENKFELEIESEVQLTKRVQAHLEYSSAHVYHYGLEYRFNEQISAEAAYSNLVDYSAGVNIRF